MRRLLGAVAIILTFCGTAYGEGNLVPNASFEELKGFDGENPAGWWSWNSDHNGLTASASRTGEQAVQIGAEAANETHSGVLYRYRNVVPGKIYDFSCFVKNSTTDPVTGGAYGQLSIEWLKNEKETERTWGVTWGPDISDTDWKKVEMTAIAPADADACNFVIQFFRKDGSGSFYADDVTVEEK